MESAIPGHLTVERTRHRRVPDEYAPLPAFVARNRGGVRQVVMAYLGCHPGTGLLGTDEPGDGG